MAAQQLKLNTAAPIISNATNQLQLQAVNETELPQEFSILLKMCKGAANSRLYRQALGGKEEREQAAWLSALEIWQELDQAELIAQLHLELNTFQSEAKTATTKADNSNSNNKSLWTAIYNKLASQAWSNGFELLMLKDGPTPALAWLPQTCTFSDYLAQSPNSEDQLVFAQTKVAANNQQATYLTELQIIPTQVHSGQPEPSQKSQRNQPSGKEQAHAHALTGREYEVMLAILTQENLPRGEVAALLNLSESTLNQHLSKIYRKLGVTSIKAARHKFTQLYNLAELLAS